MFWAGSAQGIYHELKKIMKQLVDQGKAERVKQTNIEHALNELMPFDYPNFLSKVICILLILNLKS
ncbi:hypothetical protein [Candidatus Protochlamydia sp. W-9]|uniref:hypothetical protein n=1 Tax=Candidatus Protochlamydia sp. W-9 TaxID=1785087 RepID=UPI00096AC023|nr:hypothetical protein [Candidatus Protochlamydia sp. W-9]